MNNLAPVLDRVAFILAERRYLRAVGPHFVIVHESSSGGSVCSPGEIVSEISIAHGGHRFEIPLSLTLRLLFDFLARHPRSPQTPSEIAARFRSDQFCARHGLNIAADGSLTRNVSRTAVRVYVGRIRAALALSFNEANLRVEPCAVLTSEKSGYRLRGAFEWAHPGPPERAVGLEKRED
jgi:hypothetical protein